MISSDIARVVISGTFRRDRPGLERLYHELVTTGCQVLSPRRMEFDGGEFVRDLAEQKLDPKSIEDTHLVALEQSDMMWLHAPNGYVGCSGALEIGYAIAKGIPIFSNQPVSDVSLREYVRCVPSVYAAKMLLTSNQE